MTVRAGDFVILGAVLACAVAAGWYVYGGREAPGQLVVEAPGGSWIYPLDQDREIEVSGPLGLTIVHIYEGKAHIEASPCPNKTCVASPPIGRKGEWTACLPNRVFIRIEGEEENVDVVGY